jgi:hypothetical protein
LEIRTPLQIYFPNHIFYSIPQKDIWLNTPIKFDIVIFNKTSTRLHLNPLQPIIPELVTGDGQVIQKRLVNIDNPTINKTNISPQQPNSGNSGSLENPHKCSSNFRLLSKLILEHDILKLKIHTFYNYSLNSPIPQSFWCFDGLEARKYKLRFILNTNIANTSFSELNTNQEVSGEENSAGMIESPWLNISLVQPVSPENLAIEANGATFKLVMAESVFTIPIKREQATGNKQQESLGWAFKRRWRNKEKKTFPRSSYPVPLLDKESEAKTDIKLGITITNNTSTSLHFFERACIDVALMDDDGKQISTIAPVPIPGTFTGKIIDHSVKAGESIYINLDSIISWRGKNLLQLAIPKKKREKLIGAYSYFCFGELVQNKQYYLYVTYHFLENVSHLEEKYSEKIWSGWVTLPPVRFTLVEP